MAFTDNCDLFAAVHEAGLNRIAHHLMRQRPSLFNYGTQIFAELPELLCRRIETHPEVRRRKNPLITIEDPISIPGTDGQFGLDFCAQLTALKIDLHPGNLLDLPPELDPPLKPQRLALFAEVCGGLICHERQVAERTGDSIAARAASQSKQVTWDRSVELPQRAVQAPAWRPALPKVLCFCLEAFGIGRFEVVGPDGAKQLVIRLERLEVVDIAPDGLESNVECFLATTLRVGLLPKLHIALDTVVLELGKLATLSLSPTPITPAVPNNPAIEDELLKVFVNVGVAA